MTRANISTRRSFVVGWPIEQSRSPLIHGHWLSAMGLDGSYDPIAVKPDCINDFLAGLTDRDEVDSYVGGNVTLPYKEAAFHACGQVTAIAARLGAVNTLWIENGVLWGDNTDVYGFAANLDQKAPDWDKVPGPALVLGAGGAARAIILALKERGFKTIRLSNRTTGRATRLAMDLELDLDIVAWDCRHDSLADCKLLVNTTSLGMSGQPSLDLQLSNLDKHCIVTDIVYAPLKTRLLAAAENLNIRTVDGLGMLLNQAVPGFARWFGKRPRVTPRLRALVVADLDAESC